MLKRKGESMTKTIKDKAKATTEAVGKSIEKVAPFKFSKKQLLKSNKYVGRRDALNVLLKDDETYSFAQVDEILEKFYKGGKK